MNNPGYDTSKTFEGIESFQERIVAFVDAMGIRERMKNANTPQDLKAFSQLMYMFGNQPFAYDKIQSVMFSDCMYLVAEPQYVNQLICLLSNFAYNLLVNRTTSINCNLDGTINDEIRWDCIKLRGGITYGKVLVLDEEAKKKKINSNFNMVLGPATIDAYNLESKLAIYPRIIIDDSFLTLLKQLNLPCIEHCFVRDDIDDIFYLDFWRYMFKGEKGPLDFLSGCIEYVNNEYRVANEAGDTKLIIKLKWYIDYLEKCRVNGWGDSKSFDYKK